MSHSSHPGALDAQKSSASRDFLAGLDRFVPAAVEPQRPYEDEPGEDSLATGGFDFHLGVYVRF